MATYFEPIHGKHKIYRSRGRKHPSAESRPLFSPIIDMGRSQPISRYVRGGHPATLRDEERMLERLLETLASELVSMVAVVNERLELLHLSGESAGLLRLPSGKQINDITRMAERELAIPLATGLQKVFSGQRELKYNNVKLAQTDGIRTVQMHIRALAGKRGQEPLAGVFIREMPNVKAEPPTDVAVYDLSHEAEERIRDLEQELQFTKENLQATIEELETSNEELQATNEELLASNEELQSTNEELQSVNEELHTVNTEYQTKILELTEMTNDLENLMAATELATLFLDENLNIRKFTPELTKVFRIIGSDVGRPFVHLTHTLVGEDPLTSVSEVAKTGRRVTKPVLTRDGGSYLMQVMPYHVGGSTPSGVLLTFIDIASLQAARLELREAKAVLSNTRRLAATCSWRLNLETGAMAWSSGTATLFGIADELLPHDHEQFLALIHPDDRDRYDVERRESAARGQPGDSVFRVLLPDGAVRVIHELTAAIDDDASRQLALVGILQDITEQPGLLCGSCPRIERFNPPPKPAAKARRKTAGRD